VNTTIGIDTDLCQGCGTCVGTCPRGAIHIEGGVAVIDRERCDACEACLASCPQGPLHIVVEGQAEVVRVPVAAQMPIATEGHRSALSARRPPRASVAAAIARFLGSEVLPRALSTVLAMWDSRLSRGTSLADGAGLSSSIPRDVCSERTTASLALHLHGKSLSPPCPETDLASRIAMRPIGIVHNELGPHRSPPRAHGDRSTITVHAEYADGLLALGSCEKLHILFCFDRALAKKVPLHQHPMGDRGLPVRGVFALRSPHRPNPIGLTTVTLLRVEGNVLTVSGLDAWDGTPVLDIKPFIGG